MSYTETVMHCIEIIGIAAFAVSGAMLAIRKHVDLFGVVFLAVVTATGGGIIRDLILGALPPKTFLDCTNVFISIIVALSVFIVAFWGKEKYETKSVKIDNINNVFDALGLGVFVVIGSQSAIDYGFAQNGFLVVTIGMITGIGGGILRDIMVQEIPFVLKKHIYALAALAGSLVYYYMYINHYNYTLSVFFGSASTFILRMLATRFKWDLPPAF